ncbi:cyclin-dependent kinase protein [Rutstroemia sp. NJR-2017a BBW]|nr:cyclin-dependent kinase protein [Rutstroemia sp. NJR-2017a BBW]
MDHSSLAIAALEEIAIAQSNTSHCRDIPDPGNLPSSIPIDATETRVFQPLMSASHTTEASNTAHEQLQEGRMAPSNLMSLERGGKPTANVAKIQPAMASASTSNNSQSTVDAQETVSTSPTSEGFSSQSTNQDGGPLSQLSQVAAAQVPLASKTSPTRSNIDIILNAGHKRTADGHVKTATSNSPPSPRGQNVRRHNRNNSTVSNASSVASRIGELSSELRTRLSYAMVKVNNGWESNSINEVETLASQAGSPTSSTSTFNNRRNILTSPRAVIANKQGQGSRDVFGPRTPVDFDLYPRPEIPSRTYESFWRDHSVNGAHSRPAAHPSSSQQSKSLAPPADIRPTVSSRRSDPKFSRPPSIPGYSSTGSRRSFHNNSAPRTPNIRPSDFGPTEKAMTPSQKTLQEQDAIETLLFMSSPGNSNNMGLSLPQSKRAQISPQHSPLRAEFSLQAAQNGRNTMPGIQNSRRVEFAESVSSATSETGSGLAVNNKDVLRKEGPNSKGSRREAIEKLLDEMGDSSDEEVELAAPQRRGITGRV